MVVPLALSLSFPPGLGPANLLTAVRAPFHVHPPHSYAMLVVHLHPIPKSSFSGDQRSVGEPAPRARTTGSRLPCLLTTGPCSMDIICISWKYPHSMDIIRISWIYMYYVDTICILWKYPCSVDNICISWKYPRPVDIIRIS